MNIFITGAHGFVGRNLTEYLSRTSKYTLFTPKSSELNLLDENAVDEYVSNHNIEIIIHGANRGGGRDTAEINDVVHTNLRMFFNIAKQSTKVKKIIHLGSGAEYGKHKPIVDALEVDALLALPQDDYGFYKSICARYIDRCDNIYNLRIFGAYGKYENYRFKFISNAIVKNLLGLPIEIMQNVYFDYIDIDDMVAMIKYFIEHDGQYRTYNISKGEKVDLVTLAQTINEVSEFKSDITVKNLGLNLEYTSLNNRIMSEYRFHLSTHRETITRLMDYYRGILPQIDVDEIRGDDLAKKIAVAKKL
ncbi:MAG: NAD-dependent epimerase/dehydratase family protein [Sulfuricurvum sp.]|uniref:NAD-dependent epimerase/dehydratase family protein n=1 Tax=Sulfuricurvum sp. TaxID=2025608 RepID=UPI00262CC852|nr:NAD-dependent epimerase/dehydratase family protein [Sulfuricurvum sp.]MDD2828642.1 NAD-dependent epimerase/dehydratase family protein [Sulfuricurvum sp.]MDD4948319.1 NAD-dependent epimerase/dehydratase family protein [Sulfuricurvum sp.]